MSQITFISHKITYYEQNYYFSFKLMKMYEEIITYWKFWKRKTVMSLWVTPIILFRAKNSLSESVNPIDVASISYQSTRKFWTGLMQVFSFHFSSSLWQIGSLQWYLSKSDVFNGKNSLKSAILTCVFKASDWDWESHLRLRKRIQSTVADPGFSRGGGVNPPGGAWTRQIFPKTAWNRKNLDAQGGACVPHAPP